MTTLYNPELSHFDLDMERGQQGEFWLDRLIETLQNKRAQVEVKTDYWFPVSGRIYVETECRTRNGKWRPSGIATTKARIWVFVGGRHGMAWVVETEWLRRAVEESAKHQANLQGTTYGQNPTRGVLVYANHLFKTRDVSLDEHTLRHIPSEVREQTALWSWL